MRPNSDFGGLGMRLYMFGGLGGLRQWKGHEMNPKAAWKARNEGKCLVET